MNQLPSLISDLALILVTAALTTLLFKRIKQPVVLGYIIAGILVGPHLLLTPTVVDTTNIETLADMGVIFLLFSLGLEFSFRKLQRVGGSSSITAVTEIVLTVTSGFFVGKLLGWPEIDCLFLGGMVASSSTSIIIKAFEDLKVKTRNYTKVVFGVLVIEDIVVVIVMVLLSTVAVAQHIEGKELAFTIVKLLFFLALWFIIGIFLIPTLYKKTNRFLDEETTLILSIGLCLLMVVLATRSGFSAELGAFVMGSILAETTFAEKIEDLVKPIKNLFGAIFFVSVGMLMDPSAIIEHWLPVMLISMLLIFGKPTYTTIGAMLSGQPFKQALQVGMSMGQIGEFSFIVATLGMSLGVTSDFLFPIAVGVSAITTFTTPIMMKSSEPFADYLMKKLPSNWIKILQRYSSSAQTIQAESEWKTIAKKYISIVVTNGLIIAAIMLLSSTLLIPFVNARTNYDIRGVISFSITLVLISPFLWALMTKHPETLEDFKKRWTTNKFLRWPLLIIDISRIVIGVMIIVFLVERMVSTTTALIVVVPITLIMLALFSKRITGYYKKIEDRFISNLNDRESANLSSSMQNLMVAVPADIHIVNMEVLPDATFAGKKLSDLAWRERYGINIAYVRRGDTTTCIPQNDMRLFPFDRVGVIGTDDQLDKFKREFETTRKEKSSVDIDDIVAVKFVVDDQNHYAGKSIRETHIYRDRSGLVIRILRNGTTINSPVSDTIFEKGDIVWLVGDRFKINKYI